MIKDAQIGHYAIKQLYQTFTLPKYVALNILVFSTFQIDFRELLRTFDKI